ncbi:hypothetical protein DMC30DRAFT_395119 [Rhodotorula diobovata]|uniref:Uncharacterized protein n=1 Tax=Rhodotorula diobovata TaxID=5288 RepID=A0A5C5FYD2_9BASI|nr:hypothetical protein DMC30DRAFT_395119 [Rhodotorula diobovata]
MALKRAGAGAGAAAAAAGGGEEGGGRTEGEAGGEGVRRVVLEVEPHAQGLGSFLDALPSLAHLSLRCFTTDAAAAFSALTPQTRARLREVEFSSSGYLHVRALSPHRFGRGASANPLSLPSRAASSLRPPLAPPLPLAPHPLLPRPDPHPRLPRRTQQRRPPRRGARPPRPARRGRARRGRADAEALGGVGRGACDGEEGGRARGGGRREAVAAAARGGRAASSGGGGALGSGACSCGAGSHAGRRRSVGSGEEARRGLCAGGCGARGRSGRAAAGRRVRSDGGGRV